MSSGTWDNGSLKTWVALWEHNYSEDIKASYGTEDGAFKREQYSSKIMMSYNWEKKQLEVE